MPYTRDLSDEAIDEAVELARDVAPELDAVLLTHYPDAEALDTVRPGEIDLGTARAVNRAVAAEMIDQGVEVFVQRADRAAFRRWMQERENTPENRRAWIDRCRLLRGAIALRLLGVDADASSPPGPEFDKAPGPIADQLLAAFIAGSAEVTSLAVDLLTAGRDDVLDLAIRKASERHGGQNADELATALQSAAEGGAVGPSGWAELVTLPVALPAHGLPDAAALGESLLASGAFEETTELRFLPGWRSPQALARLAPGALRRVLLDMVAGTEPRDLPAGEADELVSDGFGVLVGLQIDWDIPVWDEIAAAGGFPGGMDDEEAAQDPEQARMSAIFDRWRTSVFQASGGCVPLALVSPSEVGAEIAEFLDEAGAQTRGLEEIVEFIAKAKQQAGDEDIVCRVEIVGEGLELALYTEAGRFLDGLTVPEDRLPARAVEMPRLIGSFVRVVREAPGR
ncbi:hypothetical protein [Roseomonas sp. BN140053]|uniref:hypothetical protein n=1 Tax=Roseomonas sp. BN140053 TaxID=3391898 RepID=UPI0039EB3929